MNFDADKTVSYWIEGAEYDLSVAEAMLKAEKYPYALFMGHLAIEKLLKAFLVKTTHQHAPHTHSLPILASKLTEKLPEEVTAALARFMEFYLESRYPDQQKQFYQKCTREFTEQNFNEVKRVFSWLKKKF
jgi:HEPN domain-containing protein